MFEKAPGTVNNIEFQFANREKFLINGVNVEVLDITPDNPKTEVPVLVAPGWGATIESFKPGLEILVEKGRRAISLTHPRKGGEIIESSNEDIEEWYKKHGKKFPKFPKAELLKANTILGLIDQKKLDKVDVIAHSEASINVCLAAMLHPEKFTGKTIELYAPAGVIGKDTFWRLKKGAGATTSRTETVSKFPVTKAETEYLESTAHITPDYIKANPLRALKEVIAISRAQITDMLRYLHEKGVRIIIIGAVDDTMFPMNSSKEGGMQKNVKKDFVDGFLSVKGGHMQIQVHPELYMSAAESMLTAPGKDAKK